MQHLNGAPIFVQLFSLYAISSVLYRNTTTSVFSIIMIIVSITAVICCSLKFRHQVNRFFCYVSEVMSGGSTYAWLIACIAAGVALRVTWTLLFPAEPTSDFYEVVTTSKRFLQGGVYENSDGKAVYGPGMPVLLALFTALFGTGTPSFFILNVSCFIATVIVCYKLGLYLGNFITSRITMMIITLWPNYIFYSPLPTKDNVLSFLVPLSVLIYLAFDRAPSSRIKMVYAFFTGIVCGITALFQPSFLLLPLTYVGYALCVPGTVIGRMVKIVSLLLGFVFAVLPWSIRNYIVFDAFVPIATSGGVNFYMANHPKSTGGWTQEAIDEIDALRLPELEQSAYGYKKGFEFIASNPAHFIKNVFQKNTRVLGDDSEAAYWVLIRGTEDNEELYLPFVFLSNVYWVAVMVLLYLSMARIMQSGTPRHHLGLLALALAYPLVVHSVFEGQSRHHLSVGPLLALLAAAGIGQTESQKPGASAGHMASGRS